MFLDDNFILKTKTAQDLYHNHAKDLPIIDYHSHLNPQDIYENKPFEDLSQVWIYDHGAGDHYKWRLMRTNGVDEELITGSAEPYEKFLAFCKTMEKAIGNPVYEWANLELRRYFGIDLPINEKNAPEIWRRANEQIQSEGFGARDLLDKMNVEVVCTTDDPADELPYHKLLREMQKETGLQVLPTLRPDKLMNINAPDFLDYLKKLEKVSGQDIKSYDDLMKAMAQRVDFFHSVGGRLADHGLNELYFEETSPDEVEAIFQKRLNGETLSEEEVIKYQSLNELNLMKLYKDHGWTLQMHMNVDRNVSNKNFAKLGPDAGFDSIGTQPDLVRQLKALLQSAQDKDSLPKMILYSLNQADLMALASLMQDFQGEVPQQLQLGAAWWQNDTHDGIRHQLETMAQQSLLGNFTGMLTDSRSFLSYPRHEYFRRILADTIGDWAENGRVPDDEEMLGKIVEDISYNNPRTYFGFEEIEL